MSNYNFAALEKITCADYFEINSPHVQKQSHGVNGKNIRRTRDLRQ